MNFIELQTILQNLTNKKTSLSLLGEILDVTPANISKRAKSGSEITVSELKKIENYFGVAIYKNEFYSLERHFDAEISRKQENCGGRIADIQYKNNLSGFQMAGLLNISEKELADIVVGKALPDLRVLNNLKQNFNVSIDWVLYGE